MTTLSYNPIGSAVFALLCASLPAMAAAQSPSPVQPESAWRQCTAQTEDAARLACFDQWSRSQPAEPSIGPNVSSVPVAATTSPAGATNPGAQANLRPPAELVADAPQPNGGCRDDSFSEVSRFWELEEGTDCGTFSFRGYRPVSVQASTGSSMNNLPQSGNPVNNATTEHIYDKQEMRLQLSVRTKLASGLLTGSDSKYRDSLWVGYTQQSSWQLFNSGISRPFRNTDHEPEIMYVYPTTAELPMGWRWRYSGIGLAHQSNGQSDPLSRSWNRYYLMTGFELPNRFTVDARLWKRIKESAEDDNNPNIQNYIGRGELRLGWNVTQKNWLGVTARGSLNGHGKGSGKVEWMHTLGQGWLGGKSNLRMHATLFSGYGDSLIDYNFKRTVFSVGFSLLDF
ncbi:phospholipase A [Diaphorobacter aerolatus]|uniref:Phospholipase A1 n=1 Tax=Diaphorobacter aerolatus TaxID=1288495 RepID=A0A7H0GH88_9BURK|nr:phospholipase A [Diaphorobacter aerolatus]QNP47654.1 phospholipase A [Diaphorobacter aerolatus]